LPGISILKIFTGGNEQEVDNYYCYIIKKDIRKAAVLKSRFAFKIPELKKGSAT
jgi:hypothetical protein